MPNIVDTYKIKFDLYHNVVIRAIADMFVIRKGMFDIHVGVNVSRVIHIKNLKAFRMVPGYIRL